MTTAATKGFPYLSLIDISRPIEPGALMHPEDPAPELRRYSDMGAGDDYNLTQASLSLHTGTHYDAPLHIVRDGVSIDELPLERFVCPAHVLELGDAECLEPKHLEGQGIQPGEAVLLRTRNGELPRNSMAESWVYVSTAAAQRCVELGVGILGADYIEVEPPDTPHGQYPVHETLLPAGVLLLENLDLRQVSAGKYRLIAPPLRITGAEAAPCRALLAPLN